MYNSGNILDSDINNNNPTNYYSHIHIPCFTVLLSVQTVNTAIKQTEIIIGPSPFFLMQLCDNCH